MVATFVILAALVVIGKGREMDVDMIESNKKHKYDLQKGCIELN